MCLPYFCKLILLHFLALKIYFDKTSILSESSFQLSADLSLDLLKMKNINYYWLLISKDQHEINANMKWEIDLLPEIILARDHFSRVKNICRDNKLREFYFKLFRELSSQKENCSLMVLQKMRFVLTSDKMIQ